MNSSTPHLFLTICFYFYLLTSGFSQSDPGDLLEKWLDKRDNHTSYSFNVDLEVKWFSKDDTHQYNADVAFVRVTEDSLFGGSIYIELDSIIYGYDGTYLMEVKKDSNTAETALAIDHPGLWIASTWVNDFVETGFLTKNQGFRTLLSNPGMRTVTADTMLGEWPCIAYHIYLPDEQGFYGQKVFVAIDTIEYMMRRRIISVWFQENQQLQSWTFHNPKYSMDTSITAFDNNFLSAYTIIPGKETDTPDSTMYPPIDYSTLHGKILGKDELIKLTDKTAEITVLDFWYSSCYPCIKSIPEVNKLHERFKDRNVAVYGVNIIDNEAENKSRIEKYMRNNPMSYETIMADRDQYDHWVSEGYPMLLILDRDYKLIEAHSGYDENMAIELGAIIETHLKQ